VKALLLTDAETCLIRDKDDKIPLHFTVMRGRLGVVKELIRAMPETEIVKVMTEINDHGTVLHLCVCYNHLEALKILVESMRGDIDQILSSKDKEGNTVLDLAVKRGQIKVMFLFFVASHKLLFIATLFFDSCLSQHLISSKTAKFINFLVCIK
jgi:ankyrin repeat protein